MPLMRRGPGVIGTAARVGVASGAAGRVQHRQQQKWAAQEQPADEQPAPAPASQPTGEQQAPVPASPAQPDYVAELEQLAKLRDQGVITAEDFEAKKKQLLGI